MLLITKRLFALFFIASLAACSIAAVDYGTTGDGLKPIKLPRYGSKKSTELTQKHLEQVNALRSMAGLAPLVFNDTLALVAKKHARDMSRQQRPWHFGSDGSSPLDRVARSGYDGNFRGENIAETFEGDDFVLEAWQENAITRRPILDPDAREFGLGYYQEASGKIWWVQLFGA